MACKWIVGASAFLDVAYDAWQRAHPELQVEKIAIAQDARYQFDLTALNTLSPDEGTVFAAFDERFGNFKRMELMALLMARGFKLEPFISPRAILAGKVHVGHNAFIGEGAIVGHGSRIGYNTVLLPGAQIGHSAHVRHGCWLEAGVVVGDHTGVGAHCIVRTGAHIAHRVQIGRHCELGWPQRYDKDVAAKTTFDTRYDAPIYTYEG